MWRWHNCLVCRGPVGGRCTGKLAAMGARDLALVVAFPSVWQLVQEGQPWWGLFLAPGSRREKVSSGGGFS